MQRIATIIRSGVLIAIIRMLFAYLDPGSGSLLVQLIIAAIVGILATFRFWKSRLLRLLGKGDVDGEDENGVDEPIAD